MKIFLNQLYKLSKNFENTIINIDKFLQIMDMTIVSMREIILYLDPDYHY